MERTKIFTDIYQANAFHGEESRSGQGSGLAQTFILRNKLLSLCQKLRVKTLIDICGDYNWMKEAWKELSSQIENYIGIDIVPEMIENNNKLYATERVRFVCADIVTTPLLDGDMLLCRDVLVHLSHDSSLKFLKNFSNSNIKYLLATTFTNNRNNIDFEDGAGWYAIDMTRPPFNLVKPEIINEECTEHNGEYKDKSLGLWQRKDICGI